MANNADEIREFLRTRRDAVRPSQVGLPKYPGRRVPGLRREEVAQLAGVSVDYYTRLEQGRLTSASEGVILSIAEALQLSRAETQYLRDLLRPQPRRARQLRPRQQVRPELQRLLEGLNDQPAFVLGRRNEVLASNALLDALLTPFNQKPPEDRNLLRWLLLDPAARALYLDWAQITSEVVGVLRAEAGRYPGDPQIAAFVAELSAASPDFRPWWEERTVVERTWGTKRFDHPVVGRLDITYEALNLPGDPDQVLFVYSGSTTDDLDKLRILASWSTQHTPPGRPAPGASRQDTTDAPAADSQRDARPR
ncbi:helix-turn-helix transcriptional regulator [Streptomyces griseoviridis]|uniref:Transcriptional regulator n=1 Tax=Streptomyces griseoviridis TaxID=45398 RepID=A0A918G5F4_STRGD|nr:helix-turn-helix transcriptional regulator [Streptomyces niveoruber]GGS18026.1 transcriptional regulator [Streptomyces niveoruber]